MVIQVPLFEQWRASGREVAVVGLGKSGVAAGLLLRDHGIPTYASDIGTGTTFDAWAASLGKAGATVHIGAHDLERGTLRPWTDDYSDILGPFLSQIRKQQ